LTAPHAAGAFSPAFIFAAPAKNEATARRRSGMANSQAQFGFKHQAYLAGGAPDYQLSHYAIASALATSICFGDVVQYTNSTSPFIIPSTPSLATTAPIVGIFQGCMFIPTSGGPPTWSPFYPGSGAAQNATAYVIDAPNAVFLVAAANTAITSANIGQVANFSTAVGATTGGAFSAFTIDQSTVTSGAGATTMPFRIVGLYQGIGNGSDPTTPFNWVVVGFNNQLMRSNFGA
jgi:hypothetical protein